MCIHGLFAQMLAAETHLGPNGTSLEQNAEARLWKPGLVVFGNTGNKSSWTIYCQPLGQEKGIYLNPISIATKAYEEAFMLTVF